LRFEKLDWESAKEMQRKEENVLIFIRSLKRFSFIGITITAAIENPRSFMKKRIIDEYERNRIFSEKKEKKNM
jgi:hypothetical protein